MSAGKTGANATGMDDEAVLAMLATSTYEETSAASGRSRGAIYALALRSGARKTEARIHERAAERRRRRLATLEEIVGTTTRSDVIDYLDALPTGAATLVLTSPPYSVGKAYGGGASADVMRTTFYLGWLMQIVAEAWRVLEDGGVLALQVGSTRDDAGRMTPIDLLIHDACVRTGFTLQNRVIWTVAHGLTPSRRLSGRHETVLILTKGDAPRRFNPTAARTPQKQPGKRAFKGPNKGRLSGHPLGAWPSDVWPIANVGHNSPEKTGHPAQMPEELARRAIHLYTMPGDLVVDPFSGSGTTHAVCVETGRRFTGADLFYDDVRRRRIERTRPATVCALPGVSDESVAVWQAEARRVDHDPAQPGLPLVA